MTQIINLGDILGQKEDTPVEFVTPQERISFLQAAFAKMSEEKQFSPGEILEEIKNFGVFKEEMHMPLVFLGYLEADHPACGQFNHELGTIDCLVMYIDRKREINFFPHNSKILQKFESRETDDKKQTHEAQKNTKKTTAARSNLN